MRLWVDGEQKEAVRIFLATHWDTLTFPPGSRLAAKERDFPALSQPEREKTISQGLEVSGILRQIAKQIVAQADQLVFEKQYQQAEPMLQSVRQCGKAIAPPDSLLIMRMTGVNIQTLALEKQIDLYTATNQPDKVAARQSALKDVKAQSAAIAEIARNAPAEAMKQAYKDAAQRAASTQQAKQKARAPITSQLHGPGPRATAPRPQDHGTQTRDLFLQRS